MILKPEYIPTLIDIYNTYAKEDEQCLRPVDIDNEAFVEALNRMFFDTSVSMYPDNWERCKEKWERCERHQKEKK